MVSKLFGGGKEQAVSVSATPFQTLPPFAQSGLREAVQAGRGFLENPAIFEAVGPTSEQEAALEILRLGAQPLSAERFGEQFDVFYNPFIQETLDPAIADLQRVGREAFGDIGAQATQAGAFGSTRQALREAELGRGLAQEAGRLSAQVRSQGFESAADRALNQLARQQTGAATLFDAGEALRQLEQQTRQAPATAAQFLAALASGIPTGGGETRATSGTDLSTGQKIGQGLQLVGSIAGLFSDIRLKEDIKFLRKEGDYNIYEFKYAGSPQIYEGVMAHEVQQIKPEAVGKHEGYLTVNYSMIEPEFKEVHHGV